MGGDNSKQSLIDDVYGENLKEIGSGKKSNFFINEEHPNKVLKIYKSSNCEEMLKEYKNQKMIREAFISKLPEESLNYLDIPKVYEKSTDHEKCMILMDRVCELDKDYMPCALMGHFKLKEKEFDEKKYIGLKGISKEIDVSKLISVLGLFMGMLHFGLRLDGKGIEFVLGRDCESEESKIFAVDFKYVDKIDSTNYLSLVDVLLENYFPIEYVCNGKCKVIDLGNKALVEKFWSKYLMASEKFDRLDEAKEIKKEVLKMI